MRARIKWYDTRRWRRRARHQLAAEPLCRECLAKGIVTAATQVHHVVAHHGDEYAFWFGELASLCASCHSIETAKEQGRGVRPQIGLDGWPIDLPQAGGGPK